MKKVITWFLLFQKRLLKKPMFQITIILIPILLIMLYSFSSNKEALVAVALYTEENSGASAEFVESLVEEASGIISFYECDNENELRNDIIKGNAQCGYIVPSKIDEKIANYYKNAKGQEAFDNSVVKMIAKDMSVTTRVVNEFVCGKLFSFGSYSIMENFVKEKQPAKLQSEDENKKLENLFENRHKSQQMFSFEYADGSENVLLNNENENYYMMPVRGVLSVLILVTAMSGVLMLHKDDRNGVWAWIKLGKRPVFNYCYILCSVCIVAFFSSVAVFFTGISTGLIEEIAIMLAYIILVVGFCNLLRVLLRNQYMLCSLIPIWVFLSLILSPVFIDLGDLFAPIRIIRFFLPSNYYLEAVYSLINQIKMFGVAFFVSVISILIDKYSIKIRLLKI